MQENPKSFKISA